MAQAFIASSRRGADCIGAGSEGVLRERKSARNCIAVGAVYGAVCAKRLTACHCLPWSASASDVSLYRELAMTRATYKISRAYV